MHVLLLQRLWTLAADTRRSVSAKQYQCLPTQYQVRACADERPVGARPAHKHAAELAVIAPGQRDLVRATPRHHARVLAAVATRERRPVKAVVRESSRPVAAKSSRGTPELAPRRDEAGGSSDEWFLRSLVALVGFAMLAFLLAALSEIPKVGGAYTGVRARLASKGLSCSRIDLGDGGAAQRRRGRISYRD